MAFSLRGSILTPKPRKITAQSSEKQTMPETALLIVAAGRGQRVGGDCPKQYFELAGKTVLAHTISAFARLPHISQIITVIHKDDEALYQAATHRFDDRLMPPVFGGDTRQQSVRHGLRALAPSRPDLVLIHDAARPFVDETLVARVLDGLAQHDAVLPAISVTDTIKRVKNNLVEKTVDRADLYAAQTPQGFAFPRILELHERAAKEKDGQFTDDVSLAEWAGVKVQRVEGHANNFKLTTPRDMQMAELILAASPQMETRTGSGFDVHCFEAGDEVTLCGVTIPFDQKLKGHSDADVAMHAITDALYGALGEGDIGQHFPPSDERWKGADSSVFLTHATELVARRGGRIINIDLTIICEWPKISPHQQEMRDKLSQIMKIDAHRISIKATTTEGLGFAGRGEGIAAQAVATVSVPVEDDHV